jgi:formylglycine-generating enzyme required for sulfatase activity
MANFSDSNIGHPTPVGIFPQDRSPEGVIDLAGNVWEWCGDWYSHDYYRECHEQGMVNDPLGPDAGDDRVLRGGAFHSVPVNLRCSFRSRDLPPDRDLNIGFRVARAAQS